MILLTEKWDLPWVGDKKIKKKSVRKLVQLTTEIIQLESHCLKLVKISSSIPIHHSKNFDIFLLFFLIFLILHLLIFYMILILICFYIFFCLNDNIYNFITAEIYHFVHIKANYKKNFGGKEIQNIFTNDFNFIQFLFNQYYLLLSIFKIFNQVNVIKTNNQFRYIKKHLSRSTTVTFQ